MVPRYKALESDVMSALTGDTAMRAKTSIAFASVLVAAVAALSPANAACKKFGFTVNDYGKEGPTNDAKNLLDKHVAEWASKNGVSEYSTGKKSVSCELFLDVILFDEHTCTASATVCWGPDAKKFGTQSAAGSAPAEQQSSGDAPPAPIRKAHALGEATPQAAAAAAPAPAAEAPAADTAQIEAAPTQPVEQIAAPAEMPAAAPAVHTNAAPAAAADATPGAVVETGALQAGQGLPQAAGQQPAQPAQAPAAPTASQQERAAAAAAAASAAAAAERAAIAAETAANAAKEAAAAAVAASAASKGGAKVAPLDHASGAKPVHAE